MTLMNKILDNLSSRGNGKTVYIRNVGIKPRKIETWKCDLCNTREWKEKWRYERHCKSDKHKIKTGEIKQPTMKTWRCHFCDTGEWSTRQSYDKHCQSDKHRINSGEIRVKKKTWRCELCDTPEWTVKQRYDRHRKGKKCLKRQAESNN